jgi:hypothetical protein
LLTLSLSTLSLSSRHTILPRLCPRKDNQPAGGRGGERKSDSRVRPPSPLAPIGGAASREIHSAFPARCACPLARGERRSTPSAADRRRGTPLLCRPIRRFLTPTVPPVGCRGRPVTVSCGRGRECQLRCWLLFGWIPDGGIGVGWFGLVDVFWWCFWPVIFYGGSRPAAKRFLRRILLIPVRKWGLFETFVWGFKWLVLKILSSLSLSLTHSLSLPSWKPVLFATLLKHNSRLPWSKFEI